MLPNGDLINTFDLIIQDNLQVAVQRSTNKGRTWSPPVIVSQLGTIGVVDPVDGAPVRTGDILPGIAVDPRKGKNTAYLVWQDARFTGLSYARRARAAVRWRRTRASRWRRTRRTERRHSRIS